MRLSTNVGRPGSRPQKIDWGWLGHFKSSHFISNLYRKSDFWSRYVQVNCNWLYEGQ